MILTLPEDMDVPASRRDTTQPQNIRWLIRNLGIRNSKHPQFKVIMQLIVQENIKNDRREAVTQT